MGTCALDAALGTRSPTLRLPVKTFRVGRSNRCILTVHRLRRNAPAMCDPLLLPEKEEHFRVTHRERAPRPLPRPREAGFCACAYDSTGRGRRERASSVARAAAGTRWKPKASWGGRWEAWRKGLPAIGNRRGCRRGRRVRKAAEQGVVCGSTPGGFLSSSWVPGSDASRKSPRFLGVPAGHAFPQVPPATRSPLGHKRAPSLPTSLSLR